MMWRKPKKISFRVVENGKEIEVKNGMLFAITETGEIVVYDGAEAPYNALMAIRNAAGKLMELLQDTMERKMEEANSGICADDPGRLAEHKELPKR